VVSGFIIDRTGNWQLPFVGSMVLMGVGVLLAYRMRPDKQFEESKEAVVPATDLQALS
jgi:cyanate permease